MTSPDHNSALGARLTAMEAVAALYGEGRPEVARAIVGSLNRRIFSGDPPQPSGLLRRLGARLVVRLMQRNTTAETRTGPDGKPVTVYRNRILERSGHPYAATMMEPTRADTSSFVEGGDPMNSIYMMVVPEIARHAGTWDKLILDSVQSRDVQWRLVWETRLTHELAVARLKTGGPVRLKAVAAGAGLSMVLVVERLLEEGYDPSLITAVITDREHSNIAKAHRLISKLPLCSRHLALHAGSGNGIFLHVEDVLSASTKGAHEAPFDVITVVGLLEYFPGHTMSTTEEHLGQLAPAGPPTAADVARNVAAMTTPGGFLLTNTYRLQPAARLMENFGKRFRYRGRKEMAALLAEGGFVPAERVVSANIFDLEVYRKSPA